MTLGRNRLEVAPRIYDSYGAIPVLCDSNAAGLATTRAACSPDGLIDTEPRSSSECRPRFTTQSTADER